MTGHEMGHKKLARLFTPESLEYAKKVGDALGAVSKGLGMSALTGYGLKRIWDRIGNDHRSKAIIEDLIKTDPILREADRDQVLEFYATIYNVAPTLSKERPLVREVLTNAVKFGRLDLNTLKALIDAEGHAAENKSSGSFLGTALKSL